MLTPSLTKLHMTGEVDECLLPNFVSGADGSSSLRTPIRVPTGIHIKKSSRFCL